MCQKCNVVIKGIKNIDVHILECTGDEVKDADENPLKTFKQNINILDEERRAFRMRITALEAESYKLKDMELALKIEQMKNHIYKQIIEQKLGIVIDDMFSIEDGVIHTYDLKDCILSVIVHEHLKGKKGIAVPYMGHEKKTVRIKKVEPVDNSPKVRIKKVEPVINSEEKPKGESYRQIKNQVELIEEKSDKEREEKVYKVKDEIEEIILTNFEECDVDKILAIIEDCFHTIRNGRKYTNSLETIHKHRSKLMCRMTIDDYIKLINKHNNTLFTIFVEKEHVKKKIPGIIAKSMSSLDMRLLFYHDYTRTSLEIDDINQFTIMQGISVVYPEEFVPFSKEHLYEQCRNYSSILFPIDENIKRYMFNHFGFLNIIYLPLPKSSKTDPYSFYILEKLSKDKKRNWKMDCRIEDLANGFINNVRPYLIDMFRKIYYDIFHDNEYRADYINKSQLTEYECEQLINNILYLGDPVLFALNLGAIIMKNATYIPTANDKFNLCADDHIQKRYISEYKPEESDALCLIKTLFDDMSSENALTFYRSKKP